MQVLEILQSSGQDLYPEDLAFFEAELDTGDYAPEYIDQCKELILQIRQQKKQTQKQIVQEAIPSNLLVDPDRLIPGTEPKEKTPEERLADMDREIRQMRTANNYKTRFRQYRLQGRRYHRQGCQ